MLPASQAASHPASQTPSQTASQPDSQTFMKPRRRPPPLRRRPSSAVRRLPCPVRRPSPRRRPSVVPLPLSVVHPPVVRRPVLRLRRSPGGRVRDRGELGERGVGEGVWSGAARSSLSDIGSKRFQLIQTTLTLVTGLVLGIAMASSKPFDENAPGPLDAQETEEALKDALEQSKRVLRRHSSILVRKHSSILGEPEGGGAGAADGFEAQPQRVLRRHSSILGEPEGGGAGVADALKAQEEQPIPQVVIPPCPWDETTNIDEGLGCYWPGCKCTATSWVKMFHHVKNWHKAKRSQLKDTHLYKMALPELNEEQIQQRQKRQDAQGGGARKKAKSKGQEELGAGEAVSIKQEPGASTTEKEIVTKQEPEDKKESTTTKKELEDESGGKDGGVWTPMLCWIKCTTDGAPFLPLEFGGLVPDDAGESVPKQTTLDANYGFPLKGDALRMAPPPKHVDNTKQLTLFQTVAGSSKPTAGVSQPGGSGAHPTHGGQQLVQAQDNLQVPHPIQMIQEMYTSFQGKQKEEDDAKCWKEQIPGITIKQVYIDTPAPKAKREDDVGRANWPKGLRADKVPLPEFQSYMEQLNKGEEMIRKLLQGAGRALGLIQVSDDTPITDVKILVGFFLNETYDALVELPLLHPKFFWAANLLEGFGNYITYWIWKLKKMQIKGEPGPLSKYIDCLELFWAEYKEVIKVLQMLYYLNTPPPQPRII